MSAPIRRGETIAPARFGPFSGADLAAYADASGDDNPLHLDAAVATAAGLSAPPIHGMLIMACLEPYLAGWRPEAQVTKLSAKFIEPMLVGEVVEVSGKVVQATAGAASVVRLAVKRGAALVCLAEAHVHLAGSQLA